MTEVLAARPQLLNRARRISGQVGAVERALEKELDCAAILQLLASVRGAVNGLMAEIMEEHVRRHVSPGGVPAALNGTADELVAVIRAYLK